MIFQPLALFKRLAVRRVTALASTVPGPHHRYTTCGIGNAAALAYCGGGFCDGDLAPARQHRRHFDGDIQAIEKQSKDATSYCAAQSRWWSRRDSIFLH
jgi:hypothetical protein